MAKEWKEGWKVIMKGTRTSCAVVQHSVHYPKNEIAGRPKHGGPLAVFKTRQAARNFVYEFYGVPNLFRRVVKCLYQESKHTRLWRWMQHAYIESYRQYSGNLPKGTAFAEKVKCLE